MKKQTTRLAAAVGVCTISADSCSFNVFGTVGSVSGTVSLQNN